MNDGGEDRNVALEAGMKKLMFKVDQLATKQMSPVCFSCGQEGHMTDCSVCLNCKQPGHRVKECKEPLLCRK